MRVGVVGVGGAGGFFGARLVLGGAEVTFVARGEHGDAIRRQGLVVETDRETLCARPRRVVADIAELGPLDAVILGVKAWQVDAVAARLRPRLDADAMVLPLQVGIRVPGRIAVILGEHRVLGGLCTTLSRLDGPGRIRSLGERNFIRFGELDGGASERTDTLLRLFRTAGVDAEVPADIVVAMWEKFLFAVPLGSIGALADRPFGALRADPEWRGLLVEAIREIHAVGTAHGVRWPEKAREGALALIDSLAADGKTSLQRDLRAGRPSELDDWCGAVVALAEERGVAVPLHARLYESLRRITPAVVAQPTQQGSGARRP